MTNDEIQMTNESRNPILLRQKYYGGQEAEIVVQG